MKKRNYGFTLAEVMIALGIVSVVAALTLPGLFLGLRKNVISVSLSRAIEQIEYSAQNIFHALNDYNEEHDIFSNTDILYPIVMKEIITTPVANEDAYIFTADTFDETIRAYFGCTKIAENGKTYADKFKDFDGGDVGGDYSAEVKGYLDASKVYRFAKNNIDMYAVNIEPANVNSQDSDILFICIDTNGYSEKPNRFGKDLFAFKLRNDGRVIPYGDPDNCVKGNVKDGISCSARIIMDSFKVEYDN